MNRFLWPILLSFAGLQADRRLNDLDPLARSATDRRGFRGGVAKSQAPQPDDELAAFEASDDRAAHAARHDRDAIGR